MQEMVLRVAVHPGVAAIPASENALLMPFYQLRGINKFFSKGAKQIDHVKGMAAALETPYVDSHDIWLDLEVAMAGLQQFLNAGDLVQGADGLEATIALLADCYRYPGADFLEANRQVYLRILKTTA